MSNKSEYLARLQAEVMQLHHCGATWRKTVSVQEIFQGQTIWLGQVEVFDLHDHPKAKRAYAWSQREGKDNELERFVAVLEIPPVVSALTAVQVSIVVQDKKHR
jgi:hypothetical protein